ncbi:MAG: AbrB family transcriptional regulator [Hyphomicrobiales bacterium]|nr:AbrB family transcriptional regulator [Hyphomicrobiales bacterium]
MTARLRSALQWIALTILSLLFVAGLERLGLPAALLIGPLAAAALIASADVRLEIWPPLFYLAQAVVGCLIARAFALDTISEIGRDWPLFLGGVVSVIAVAAVIGWLLASWRVLPGTTAVWGSSPGAATTMTLMSESYGADIRLVAFMQYLRVVLVVVVATVVARLAMAPAPREAPGTAWFPPVAGPSFALTAAVIVVGAAVGRGSCIPAGPLLVPIVVGALLQDMGLLAIELPPWLLAFAYVAIGWSIGLRFTKAILIHAARAAPRLVASIACLIAICAGLGAALTQLAHIDPLTAYLATSPGGADSVAIIAASAKVDVPFVMAMQTARFVLVVLTGPAIARFVAARIRE